MTIGGEEVLNEHHLLAYTENRAYAKPFKTEFG